MRAVKKRRIIPAGTGTASSAGRPGRVTSAWPLTLRNVMRSLRTGPRAAAVPSAGPGPAEPEPGPSLALSGPSRRETAPSSQAARGGRRFVARTRRASLSTRSRSRASGSYADAVRTAGQHPLIWPRGRCGELTSGLRILPATPTQMPRSAQTRPEGAQQSMIIETWTSLPRTARGPRRFVIIYRRRHHGRSGKARRSLGDRVHVAMSQAGGRSPLATALR